ncbi:MAG: nitrilase-related carbon-nitrogen hydrolase, partial [Candidatus Thorarchaeota archaeon]
MNNSLKIAICQLNPIVGDVDYNFNKIKESVTKNQDVDIIVFPEMFLFGYPIMDHIHDPVIRRRNKETLNKVKALNTKATIILGTFTESDEIKDSINPFYNSAVV